MAETREERGGLKGELSWRLDDYERLDKEDLYQLMALRQRVFVVEQQCVYLDADGLDQIACHLRGLALNGDLLAYARVFPPKDGGYAKIGRVVTSPEARGHGLGRELMRRALAEIDARWNHPPIAISAQSYLRFFYESFGFRVYGEPYLEDGIPHIAMARE